MGNNIFPNISFFPHLEKVRLSNCRLTAVGQFLLESRNLQYLDLSNNNINNIDANDFSSLANLKHMDLSSNELQSVPQNQFRYLQNLTYLNLATNKLDSLYALKGLQNIQTLIVSSNSLTTLPVFLLKEPFSLQRVDLGDNQFSCLCAIQPLQNWIMKDRMVFIEPKLRYTCTSPASKDGLGIMDFALDCRVHLEYYIPAGLSGLIVVCAMVSIIYKYRWHIHYRYWMLLYQHRYQRRAENDNDDDIINKEEDNVDAREAPIMRRRYHAYVAYHRESEDWVNDQLIAIIEDGPEPFCLCLKERGDIPAGLYVLNSICHGIYHSRKAIVVLSENFMDNGWCHYQLQIAQMRLVKFSYKSGISLTTKRPCYCVRYCATRKF